ncbi:hypothetical protein E2C01_065639 [Portunus trituberculatus]|uniref:Uncharacterized protein n=1 Tax=Portunus trituberculatus TaxID=210409 RepID=A0A5B7HJD3_PORTR|nr:hypothetical protein [Portunus trituberculatus]
MGVECRVAVRRRDSTECEGGISGSLSLPCTLRVVNRVLPTYSKVIRCLARWSVLPVLTSAPGSPPSSLTELDCR